MNSKCNHPTVAIIEPVGGHGGMDYYDSGLCSGLSSAGERPILYTSEQTCLPANCRFSVIHSFKAVFGPDIKLRRGIRYVKAMIQTLLHIRFHHIFICHFHYFHTGVLELFQSILARVLGLKVVVTAHDIEPLTTAAAHLRIASKIVYRTAHLIIAHNQWSRKELIRRLGGALSPKIHVIPHGHYVKAIPPALQQSEARARLHIAPGKKVLLFFGQIKQVKGLDLLLSAVAALRAVHPEIYLVIAGKVWKDDYSAYSNIIAHHQLHDYCLEHIGYIPNHEVAIYFSAADLVVLPYRRIYQSGVILMAMSFGKAVLASDLPGMTELIRDSETGFIFKRNDLAALVEKLSWLLSNTELIRETARRGFDQVCMHYGWETIGRLTARCYQRLRQ